MNALMILVPLSLLLLVIGPLIASVLVAYGAVVFLIDALMRRTVSSFLKAASMAVGTFALFMVSVAVFLQITS